MSQKLCSALQASSLPIHRQAQTESAMSADFRLYSRHLAYGHAHSPSGCTFRASAIFSAINFADKIGWLQIRFVYARGERHTSQRFSSTVDGANCLRVRPTRRTLYPHFYGASLLSLCAFLDCRGGSAAPNSSRFWARRQFGRNETGCRRRQHVRHTSMIKRCICHLLLMPQIFVSKLVLPLHFSLLLFCLYSKL